jgi:uncharacterized protein YqgV (UPF0045/DUF77 family)
MQTATDNALDRAARGCHDVCGKPNRSSQRHRYGKAMLIAFSVAPSGVGELSGVDASASVSAAVADAIRIVRESGLPNRTDSMFTTVEGDWDECMDVVKRACDAVGRYGSRVSLVLKADIRPGHVGELDGKVQRVEAALRQAGGAGESTSK